MDFNDYQLRSVFDLCNPDKDGFISTDSLANALAEQFSDPALVTIQDVLDPHRVGKISFQDFCTAVNKLQDNQVDEEFQDQSICFENDDSSDPENTYNEYDLPEDEISEMESFEALGESPHALSPTKPSESIDYFHRHGSIRRSLRRSRRWPKKPAPSEQQPLDEIEAASVAAEFEDLSEKVDKLQGHVIRLEEEKTLQSQYESVKQENHQLTNRVNELEEKLQDTMDRHEEMKKILQHKLKDAQREHELELQVLRSKMEVLTTEKERLKSELVFAKNGAKETRETLASIQSRSEVLTKQIMDTNEEYRRLNNRFTERQDKHETECAGMKEEINEVRLQLRLCEEDNSRLRSELSDSRVDSSSAELHAHLDSLRAENEELKRNNEELADQLAQDLSSARILLSQDEQSFAEEMSDDASKDDVLEALRKQEAMNEELKTYIEKLTMNVLDRDPEILEIK